MGVHQIYPKKLHLFIKICDNLTVFDICLSNVDDCSSNLVKFLIVHETNMFFHKKCKISKIFIKFDKTNDDVSSNLVKF